MKIVFNVGFVNSYDQEDETQLDAMDLADLFNLIDSLKSELDIKSILYIEYVEKTHQELAEELFGVYNDCETGEGI